MHHQILEGTWDQVSKKAAQLKGDTRVRLEVIEPEKAKGQMIRKGMFPGLKAITEEDFKAAEWRGPAEDEF